MKILNHLFVLFLITLSSGCNKKEVYLFSYFKGNGEDGLHLAYSKDGKRWNKLNNDQSFLIPAIGKHKLMRDPCIFPGLDGYYHMVWTVSWGDSGIGYANSKDLINWSEQQLIPVMKHEPKALNCWAPEISYDEEQEQYMIYWSTTIPGRFPATDHTGDNNYNHRMYYTTTKDFKTFSETKILYDGGFNVIDGSIVKVNDQYIMVIKDETRYPKPEKNLKIVWSGNSTGPWSKPSEPITGNYWAEGPSIIQTDNEWVVYFDKYAEGSMGAVSTSDWENWTDISDGIYFHEGVRHGTVFKVPLKVLENIQNSL